METTIKPPSAPAPAKNKPNVRLQNMANGTAIQRCVQEELRRYFEMLDGQAPHELYRMVMQQTESALISYVMEESRNNQSKAAHWLGISRGTLRGKLADINGE